MGSAEQPPGHLGGPPPGDPGDWEGAGLGARVNEIVDAVEREASKLRQEAEQEAAQIRYQAQEESRRYLEQARQRSEQLAQHRAQQIHELSDALMRRAEEVLERLEYAVPVKEGFENLVRALGETAERLANQDYAEFAPPSWDTARAPASGQGAPPSPAYGTPEPGPANVAGAGATSSAGGFQAPQQPVQQPGGQGQGWQELDDAHRVAIQMAAGGSTRGEVEGHLAQAPPATRASVLDEIFGPGTPPDTRVPWATPQR